MKTVTEYSGMAPARLLDEIPGDRPVVVRGLVADWPAVRAARQSPEALCRYLLGFDRGSKVDAVLLPPAERGRLFYQPGMQRFNFVRNQVTVAQAIEQLVRYSQFDAPPSVAIQSALIDDCLPGFGAHHAVAGLPSSVRPRLWLGNAITTPAHFDESSNLACVVAGARRFTLFPPEQVSNLYLGPLDFAPTPTPISLVDFDRPDDAAHPRFRSAQAAALVADLEPGDALFIPTRWWHHVQSRGMLNMMVNYWWRDDRPLPDPGADFTALLAALRAIQRRS
ncbi:MAG: cupin-like domain-containing protein [Duganella sp.]